MTGMMFDIYKKYSRPRKQDLKTSKLLIKYERGRCLGLNIGINTVDAVPQAVERYLEVFNPELYTGHCFR